MHHMCVGEEARRAETATSGVAESPLQRAAAVSECSVASRGHPATVRPLARDPRVLIGLPLPFRFGLGGCLLLAQRGRVYV